MARGKTKWIQKALGIERRPSPITGKPRLMPRRPGALHLALGVPAGHPIPLEMLRDAAHRPERFTASPAEQFRLQKQAYLALTLRRLPHAKGARRKSTKRRSRR